MQGLIFISTADADPWNPNTDIIPPGQSAIAITDAAYAPSYSAFSSLSLNNEGQYQSFDCQALNSNDVCPGANEGSQTSVQIALPACTSDTQTNCVASLSIGSSPSSMVSSSLSGSAPGPKISGDSGLGLPTGGTSSLWTNSTSNAGGTNTYAVIATISKYFNFGSGTFQYPSSDNRSIYYSQTNPFPFQLNVVPYSVESQSQITPPILESVPNPLGPSDSVYTTNAPANCIWTDFGKCGAVQNFSPNTEVAVSIRITNDLGGWYEARMQGTQIAESSFGATSNLISVAGESVDVPQLGVTGSPSDPGIESVLGQGVPAEGVYLSGLSPIGFAAVDALRSLANNTDTDSVNVWNFSTTEASGNACMTSNSKVLGIVSTNSLATDGSAPNFGNGFLTYDVAGMHYLQDGSLALGTYDLVMADSVAQCLYNFSNAPISGTISVTDANGVENIATSTVTDQGGWLHLAAYGFTFSNPVIKVKLTQSAKYKKVLTLKCVRGVTKRIVRGLSPKCPSGYKPA